MMVRLGAANIIDGVHHSKSPIRGTQPLCWLGHRNNVIRKLLSRNDLRFHHFL